MSTVERVPAEPSRIPSLGDAALFFVIAAVVLLLGQSGAVVLAWALHVFGRGSLSSYVQMATSDARLGVPTQALAYVLMLVVVWAVFRWLWRLPLADALQWRVRAAVRRAPWLMGLGLFCGLANGVAGRFLPMPKDPPILADMMRTPVGAWIMLLFGVTLAPLMEEIAFRGFLLPGLVHAFGWLEERGWMSAVFALPLSVVLTSLPFALLHGAQVSHAWAPLLLIGLVSVVLCVVRVGLRSVAASTLVHASYNLTLFVGVLVETDGFRHLERLS